MSRFTIYSPTGAALYEGTPTFTGQYMKPGLLEFREVALPNLVGLVPGCYVDYTRTGYRYRIYAAPQLKKQARSLSYGSAFVYQSVQLYDPSKMLEFCPFRDLVKGDNRIHFSTQPSISTFEGVDGLARRFEACLQDQYGEDSWRVRVTTIEDDGISQELADLMADAREFTVSGVNILECLDKVYEIWPEVGWVYTVEDGIDTIVIGGAGLNDNQGTYIYGKGNGLTSITRTVANANEIANRLYAYGSMRNMLPRWYNSQAIKDAESVDIQNLMIPIAEWGLTDVDGGLLPDASKAYLDNAESIIKMGLRPKTVYFDGTGEYPEIYPSIRGTTIGDVRLALQRQGRITWYPSTEIYTNPNARIDTVLSVPGSFDSGLSGEDGKSSSVSSSESLGALAGNGTVSAAGNKSVILSTRDYTMTKTCETDVAVSISGNGTITTQGGNGVVYLAVSIQRGDGTDFNEIKRQLFELSNDGSNVFAFRSISARVNGVPVSVGDVIRVYLSVFITNTSGGSALSYSYSLSPGVNFTAAWSRKRTFNIYLRQVGFDIEAQANLGDGKTIAMRSGKCAGRSFSIKSVQYDSSGDSWKIECYRSEDESLSQWFPNTDYPVEAEDEFVLLDIAMPDIYVTMAEQRLLSAAQDLLLDSATERWQFVPEIDAEFIVENSRIIVAGEYMKISDADLLGGSPVSIMVDSVTINEGDSVIPTYKVTLRDRKRKTWTESASPEGISSKPVGNATQERIQEISEQTGDSFFTLDESGNVTLKPQYQNLWVPGWLAAGGVGTGGSGGGGLINTVYTWAELQAMASAPADDVTAAVNARGVYEIWQAVKALQDEPAGIVSITSQQDGTVDFTFGNGDVTTVDLNHRHPDLEAAIAAIQSLELVPVVALPTASEDTIGKIYLVPSSNPKTENVKDEYVTIRSGSEGAYTYSWEQIGTTAVDLTPYATKVTGATNGDFAGLDANGNLVDSGHKHGDYVTALGTNGNYLTWTKNGVANDLTVPFATKAEKDGSGNTISDYYVTKTTAQTITGEKTFSQAITLSGSTNTARRIYFGDTDHFLELDQYGFHFSHGVYSDEFVSAGGIGSSSTSGGALADLVDVSLSSGLASGDLLKYDGTHWVNIPQSQIVPTVSVAFDDLTSHPITLAGYGITDAKIENGVITLGGSSITPITSNQTVTNAAATLIPGSTQTIATIGNTSITVEVPFFAMHQDIGTLNSYFTNGVANNAAQLDGHSASYFATAAALDGYVPTSRTINGVDLSQNRTLYALGTSLGTSAARGTMLGVSALSYDLSSTGSESSLIKWDTQLGAWHVYGNLYADGWVASGGIGTESGGGGYGVEEITSNQDGTVDFHFTGGDITTIDLNHEHPQYPKYVLCADEAAYNAIANKDSSTLYLIPES